MMQKECLYQHLMTQTPVLILEHRWLHFNRFCTKKIYKTDIEKPKIITNGKHLTIVASSYNIYEIIFCSEILKKFNIFLEIIDLRVLRPLNLNPIMRSIKKTKKGL